MNIEPIAYISNDYKDKFSIPRQSNIVNNIISKIIFKKPYNTFDAVKGLDGYSHIWLIWQFSKNVDCDKSVTVRPPRLGGNKRVGVFASRSPFRENNLGLSCVKLEKVEVNNNAPVLVVSGADLMDGTPIYDIKPYIKFTDCHSDAISGFVDTNEFNMLNVIINDNIKNKIEDKYINQIIDTLTNDPRPAYHNDASRIYGFRFAKYDIKFSVTDTNLTVLDVIEYE